MKGLILAAAAIGLFATPALGQNVPPTQTNTTTPAITNDQDTRTMPTNPSSAMRMSGTHHRMMRHHHRHHMRHHARHRHAMHKTTSAAKKY
jgi:hypothetical protein